MRALPFLLLALLVAPMLVAQQDPCPPTFPPESCADDGGEAAGVTAAVTPPDCSPCFTIDDQAANYSGPPTINRNCQASTGGATQFLLMATSVNGPPPVVVAIYLTESDGSCSREETSPAVSISFPAGTLSAEDLAGRCADTLLYWHTTVAPNDICENSS